jgi:hypothetical protein
VVQERKLAKPSPEMGRLAKLPKPLPMSQGKPRSSHMSEHHSFFRRVMSEWHDQIWDHAYVFIGVASVILIHFICK